MAVTENPWRGVIRWGGLSLALAGGVLVAFLLAVAVSGQTLPVPAEDMLEDPAVPTTLFTLAAVGELLLLPGILALALVLGRVDRSRVVLATSLWVVAVPLFLASRALIISVSQLSGSYQDATDSALRAGYLAAAESAIEAQNILATMGLVLLSLASILIGSIMLEGGFGRRLALLVIAAGVVTLPASFIVVAGGPVVVPLLGLVLGAAWQLVVGVKLFRDRLGPDAVGRTRPLSCGDRASLTRARPSGEAVSSDATHRVERGKRLGAAWRADFQGAARPRQPGEGQRRARARR